MSSSAKWDVIINTFITKVAVRLQWVKSLFGHTLWRAIAVQKYTSLNGKQLLVWYWLRNSLQHNIGIWGWIIRVKSMSSVPNCHGGGQLSTFLKELISTCTLCFGENYLCRSRSVLVPLKMDEWIFDVDKMVQISQQGPKFQVLGTVVSKAT